MSTGSRASTPSANSRDLNEYGVRLGHWMLQRPVKLSFRERLTVHGYQCTLAFYPNLEDRDAYREEFADMGGDRPKLKECYYIYDYEHGRMLNTSVMKNFFQPNHPALEDSYVNWDRPRQDAMGTMPKQQQELDRLQHWAMLAFKDPSVKHAVLRLDVSDETIRYGYKGAYTARVKTAFFLMNISWQYVNPSLKVQNERSQLQGESPTSAWHQRRGTGQSAASASTQDTTNSLQQSIRPPPGELTAKQKEGRNRRNDLCHDFAAWYFNKTNQHPPSGAEVWPAYDQWYSWKYPDNQGAQK